MATQKKLASTTHLNSKQTATWHGSGGEMHGAGLTRTRWHCRACPHLLYRKIPFELLNEESAISAGQTAVKLTSHTCTAHHNKHFAGNFRQLYLRTQSNVRK